MPAINGDVHKATKSGQGPTLKCCDLEKRNKHGAKIQRAISKMVKVLNGPSGNDSLAGIATIKTNRTINQRLSELDSVWLDGCLGMP